MKNFYQKPPSIHSVFRFIHELSHWIQVLVVVVIVVVIVDVVAAVVVIVVVIVVVVIGFFYCCLLGFEWQLPLVH